MTDLYDILNEGTSTKDQTAIYKRILLFNLYLGLTNRTVYAVAAISFIETNRKLVFIKKISFIQQVEFIFNVNLLNCFQNGNLIKLYTGVSPNLIA